MLDCDGTTERGGGGEGGEREEERVGESRGE